MTEPAYPPELEDLRSSVRECSLCALCRGRTNTVFGYGCPEAGLMLVGEGPGAEEDRMGLPFVGKSGQLLDKILEACGFTRENHAYIANIVKCRPPGNRAPSEDERAACLPYLGEQIRIIDPKIIVLLGATALQGLIDPRGRITAMRGKWIEWNGRAVMPTYHPSALLRTPSLKRDAWNDFRMVVRAYRERVDSSHPCRYVE